MRLLPVRFIPYLSILLSSACVVLSCWLFGGSRDNIELQATLQSEQESVNLQQQEIQTRRDKLEAQQVQIETANRLAQQTGPEILKDLASLAATNPEIEKVLAQHGLSLTKTTPASTPKPAAP